MNVLDVVINDGKLTIYNDKERGMTMRIIVIDPDRAALHELIRTFGGMYDASATSHTAHPPEWHAKSVNDLRSIVMAMHERAKETGNRKMNKLAQYVLEYTNLMASGDVKSKVAHCKLLREATGRATFRISVLLDMEEHDAS